MMSSISFCVPIVKENMHLFLTWVLSFDCFSKRDSKDTSVVVRASPLCPEVRRTSVINCLRWRSLRLALHWHQLKAVDDPTSVNLTVYHEKLQFVKTRVNSRVSFFGLSARKPSDPLARSIFWLDARRARCVSILCTLHQCAVFRISLIWAYKKAGNCCWCTEFR